MRVWLLVSGFRVAGFRVGVGSLPGLACFHAARAIIHGHAMVYSCRKVAGVDVHIHVLPYSTARPKYEHIYTALNAL